MTRAITLPEDLLKRAEQLAAFESLPVEQFVAETLSEQFADLEYLKQRAERASSETFQSALLQIPDVEPQEHDRFER